MINEAQSYNETGPSDMSFNGLTVFCQLWIKELRPQENSIEM